MAAISSIYPLGSPQEHIPICEKHDLLIDLTCEDCKEFICSQCAKTDHKDHDWKTIPTTATERRRDLKEFLIKMKEEGMQKMDEMIQKAANQIENDQNCCDSEVAKLQKYHDEVIFSLAEIKRNYTKTLKDNLEEQNDELKEQKSNLKMKRKHIAGLAKFLEENHNTMTDYSLLEKLTDLNNMMSNKGSDNEEEKHLLKYENYGVCKGLLKLMMGQISDLKHTSFCLSEAKSFRYGDKPIDILEAITRETCFFRESASEYIKEIQFKNNEKSEQFVIRGIDICLYDTFETMGERPNRNFDAYVTDRQTNSIVCLSPSNTVSTTFSTDPLTPIGICQSMQGGLLITLRDTESELYKPDSKSRRLVRHLTLTGDVTREYEYQEDGQTRLFTTPIRVKQNRNLNICVVNRTSETTSELVILSSTGNLKSIFRGQKQTKHYYLHDVVCDFLNNIIVSDYFGSQVYLLSPDGEFLKCLLTANEITRPVSMSLFDANLWISNSCGIVKVFQYKLGMHNTN